MKLGQLLTNMWTPQLCLLILVSKWFVLIFMSNELISWIWGTGTIHVHMYYLTMSTTEK